MKKKNVEFGKKTRVKQRKLYTEEDNWLEELAVSSSQLESVSKKSSTRTLLKRQMIVEKLKSLEEFLPWVEETGMFNLLIQMRLLSVCLQVHYLQCIQIVHY